MAGPSSRVSQPKQSRLGGDEFLAQIAHPLRVREITGTEHRHALLPRPQSHVFEVRVFAGRSREFRVNVQIGKEHCRLPPSRILKRSGLSNAVFAIAMSKTLRPRNREAHRQLLASVVLPLQNARGTVPCTQSQARS